VLAACGGQHPATSTTAPPTASTASVAALPAASATASPAASSPAAPHASSTATSTASAVNLPSQLVGLNKATSSAGKQDVSILAKEYDPPFAGLLVDEKSALYGNVQSTTSPSFFITAGNLRMKVTSPEAIAKGLQTTWSAQGIADVRVFPAGSGAQVVCGLLKSKDVLCAWVDSVSFGFVLYTAGFTSSLNATESKTIQIHSAVVR
jgi:hypothetical protein